MFTNPILIELMDNIIDNCEKDGWTADQATIHAVAMSLHSLAEALVEQAHEQGNPEEMRVSPMFIHGLIDTAVWMNDRRELSQLGQGPGQV